VSDVLINLVLDRSGSMTYAGKREGAIEGVNAFFAEQRALQGKALLSLTLFNTDFDVRFVGADLAEVPDLGTPDNPYQCAGGTSLYDAVITTIKGTDEWLLNHRDFTGKVLCLINTDGEENSSASSLNEVNDLINAKTAQGWEFMFLGVGQAAWTEGQKFAASIPASNYARTADTMAGTVGGYAVASAAMTTTRSTGAAFANANPDEVIGTP
jgi:hypothetical protein